jgi:hypothetical protein
MTPEQIGAYAAVGGTIVTVVGGPVVGRLP